jgi:SAM-dependent methyltransferase
MSTSSTRSGNPDVEALHERTRWAFERIPDGTTRLLDAGCHDGATTAAFRARCDQAVGIDTDVAALRAGRDRFPRVALLAASAAALPFADGAFDCVVFSEVIEHVPANEEEHCIRELWRVMRPGGRLILTTPHRGTFWWLDPLMFKTHVRRASGVLKGSPPRLKGHKHYRVHELATLLDPFFEVQSIDRVGWLLYPLAYWGYLLPLGMGRVPFLVSLWQRMMDADYLKERGDAAYSVCIIATPRSQ